MTDDRTEFKRNRALGKALHQEQRLARAQGSQPDLHPEAVKAIYGDQPPIDHDALAAEVEPWLQQCGSCDAALPMSCTCPKGDYRNILLKVWQAYEQAKGIRS